MSEQVQKSPSSDASSPTTAAHFSPRVDIVETEHELTMYADLPGVVPEHLDVRYNDAQLTIHGRVAARRPAGPWLRKEYELGDFHRVFTVGETIDASRISAELKDGVLTLHLPKVERAKPRRIEVRYA